MPSHARSEVIKWLHAPEPSLRVSSRIRSIAPAAPARGPMFQVPAHCARRHLLSPMPASMLPGVDSRGAVRWAAGTLLGTAGTSECHPECPLQACAQDISNSAPLHCPQSADHFRAPCPLGTGPGPEWHEQARAPLASPPCPPRKMCTSQSIPEAQAPLTARLGSGSPGGARLGPPGAGELAPRLWRPRPAPPASWCL